jgi:signal transduction histidine kinase
MEQKSSKLSMRPQLLKYTLIPIVPLSIIAFIVISYGNFVSTPTDHFYLEMISVIISFIIASYAILRGYAFNDKFTLFIGLGFHAAGFIDILHAIISLLSIEYVASTADFMAQTWVAGRMVMGIVILIAILKFGTRKMEEKEDVITRKSVFLYVTALSVFAVAVAIISLSVTFPLSGSDLEPNRPYEFPAALIFGLGLLYYYKKKLYTIDDNFYKGILIALIIDIFGNFMFFFSSHDFDIIFNIAHILKIISMLVIVLSLASSIVQHYKNKSELVTELKKIDKEKNEFSVMITHELRTPLTPIKGWCYALIQPKILGNLTEKQKNAVMVIDKNANMLNSIIGNLLDVQKLELNEIKYNYNETDTKNILEKVKNDFEVDAQTTNTQIEYEYDNVALITDEHRIVQVLSNLIRNSLAFVPKNNAKIKVNAKRNEDCIVFSVEDNGIGISEEHQSKLFRKFFQVDTSMTRKHGGSGLGLTICKGIIEGLGGKIWLHSQEGHGSIFYFSTPLENGEHSSC